jgi:hypothetical protein
MKSVENEGRMRPCPPHYEYSGHLQVKRIVTAAVVKLTTIEVRNRKPNA